jgi:hypothetical protein
VGTSSYNSLQATLNRRVANGLTFMLNYTFSKEEDDLAGVRAPGEDYLEYSLGALDRKHVFGSTVVYVLPFGKGQHFNPQNFVLKAIADDWRAASIVTASTSAPLSVTATCTGGGIIDASCYPNYNPAFSGSVTIAGKPSTVLQATSTPYLVGNPNTTGPFPFLSPAAYTYGNAARTAPGGLFAPHTTNIDANLRRDFPIWEGIRFAFQADVFNLLNRPYFGAPNTSITSTSYGTYTSQANNPRKYQFSGRITF